MPEFLDNIQQAAKDPTGWISPHTVADRLEIDFHTMQLLLRKLLQSVESFRAIGKRSLRRSSILLKSQPTSERLSISRQ